MLVWEKNVWKRHETILSYIIYTQKNTKQYLKRIHKKMHLRIKQSWKKIENKTTYKKRLFLNYHGSESTCIYNPLQKAQHPASYRRRRQIPVRRSSRAGLLSPAGPEPAWCRRGQVGAPSFCHGEVIPVSLNAQQEHLFHACGGRGKARLTGRKVGVDSGYVWALRFEDGRLGLVDIQCIGSLFKS